MSWRGLASPPRRQLIAQLPPLRTDARVRFRPIARPVRCACACSALALRRISPAARRSPLCLVRSPADLSASALRGTCPVRSPSDCSVGALRGLVPRPVPADCSAGRSRHGPDAVGGRSLSRPHLGTTSTPSANPPELRSPAAPCVPEFPPGRSPSLLTCRISSAATGTPARGSSDVFERVSWSTGCSTGGCRLSPTDRWLSTASSTDPSTATPMSAGPCPPSGRPAGRGAGGQGQGR